MLKAQRPRQSSCVALASRHEAKGFQAVTPTVWEVFRRVFLVATPARAFEGVRRAGESLEAAAAAAAKAAAPADA